MGRSIIPSPGEGLQFIFVEDSGGSLVQIKASVAIYNDLPTSGNTENDLRITRDTDNMYTWSIVSGSGVLDDWKNIGSVSSVDWSGITNGPSSSPANIDDAVAKKHTKNTDTILDEGGLNEKSVANLIISTAAGDWKKVLEIQYNPISDDIKFIYEE